LIVPLLLPNAVRAAIVAVVSSMHDVLECLVAAEAA